MSYFLCSYKTSKLMVPTVLHTIASCHSRWQHVLRNCPEMTKGENDVTMLLSETTLHRLKSVC